MQVGKRERDRERERERESEKKSIESVFVVFALLLGAIFQNAAHVISCRVFGVVVSSGVIRTRSD